MVTFLLPGDPSRPVRTDPPYLADAAAARAAGARTAPVDLDALLSGDRRAAVRSVPPGAVRAWYRGPALSARDYSALCGAVRERGGTLATAPDRYRAAHELPGWHAAFGSLTPPAVWLGPSAGAPPGEADLARLARGLGGGPGLLTGWARPPEGASAGTAYVSELADAGRLAAAARVLGRDGGFPVEGVALRVEEAWAPAGRWRVWWVAGEPVLTTSPSGEESGSVAAADLARVAAAVRSLDTPFVTTDMALRRDGARRVVDVEDGQVVPLPEDADARHLFEALVAVGSGMPLRLAGERVVLTALPPGRCAEVADGCGGGLTWIGGLPSEGTAEAAGMVVRAAAAGLYQPGWGVFAIRNGSTGTALGGIGFHGPPDDGTVEIGYDLDPRARGAGWATEATRLLAAWSAARPDVREVVACTEPDNAASQAVLVRAGFHRTADRDGLLGFRYAGGPGTRVATEPSASVERR